MFQRYSLQSSHPHLLPESKSLSFISVGDKVLLRGVNIINHGSTEWSKEQSWKPQRQVRPWVRSQARASISIGWLRSGKDHPRNMKELEVRPREKTGKEVKSAAVWSSGERSDGVLCVKNPLHTVFTFNISEIGIHLWINFILTSIKIFMFLNIQQM